jgi:hypothetical protein
MRDGEEGVTDEDDVVEVAVVEEDDELIKVIPVLDSTPPRQAYKQMARIWISPRGSTHWNPSTKDECKGIQPGLPRYRIYRVATAATTGSTHQNPSTKDECNGSRPGLPKDRICRVAATTISKRTGHHRTTTTVERRPEHHTATASEQPPLRSPIEGRILRRFTHLMKLSHPGRRPGAWDLPH